MPLPLPKTNPNPPVPYPKQSNIFQDPQKDAFWRYFMLHQTDQNTSKVGSVLVCCESLWATKSHQKKQKRLSQTTPPKPFPIPKPKPKPRPKTESKNQSHKLFSHHAKRQELSRDPRDADGLSRPLLGRDRLVLLGRLHGDLHLR